MIQEVTYNQNNHHRNQLTFDVKKKKQIAVLITFQQYPRH